MNKDRVYLELTTASDLSEAALHAAVDKLIEYKLPLKEHPDFSYKMLRVASQNLGLAIVLSKFFNAAIDISWDYSQYEWSLVEYYYGHNKELPEYVMVHSSGA